MWVARYCRDDCLRAVNATATRVTKWKERDDEKLAREVEKRTKAFGLTGLVKHLTEKEGGLDKQGHRFQKVESGAKVRRRRREEREQGK